MGSVAFMVAHNSQAPADITGPYALGHQGYGTDRPACTLLPTPSSSCMVRASIGTGAHGIWMHAGRALMSVPGTGG